MSIVLNEYAWAEEAIRTQTLGSKPSETLGRIAKYYISRGSSKKEVRKLLETFLRSCDPAISIPRWSNVLDYSVNKAVKYGIIDIDSVDVTDEEMKVIDSITGRQTRRLAFTLLCLAKYWDAVNPTCDHWVINKDSEIMSLANINTSLKRQGAMYKELNDLGLVQFSKKVDNTSTRVCFVKPGNVVMKLCDFRDLGYQYLMYHGEPYHYCESCGAIIKKKATKMGRPVKYCPECTQEVKTRQSIESAIKCKRCNK